uniref:Uncharacterized protein n=1 Tax=Arundo donax TaxID=35708 RepID=A0A0A9F0C2_ARUDO
MHINLLIPNEEKGVHIDCTNK